MTCGLVGAQPMVAQQPQAGVEAVDRGEDLVDAVLVGDEPTPRSSRARDEGQRRQAVPQRQLRLGHPRGDLGAVDRDHPRGVRVLLVAAQLEAEDALVDAVGVDPRVPTRKPLPPRA
jgi:hypothetical protein